jgi:hypothetical protein
MAALDRHLHAWILRKFKTDPYFQPVSMEVGLQLRKEEGNTDASLYSSLSFFLAQAYLVKENTKPWTSSDGNDASLATSLLNTLSMDQ